ncbi:hypothetical protein GW17_00057932 [Ensete ventricosum]|nr:hypothetical protein GW17_00057932 [Ensete ventricosum]
MLVEVCLATGALVTSGPPSSTKNISETWCHSRRATSARLGSARVRKLIRVGREEVRLVVVRSVGVVQRRGTPVFINWISAQSALRSRLSQCSATSAQACASRIIMRSQCYCGLLT